MKLRTFILLATILILTTLGLTGCNTKSPNSPSSRQTRIANNELIVAIGSEPENGFDSTTGGHGSITKILFSTLFKRNQELGWANDLATGYEISEDKLTWTVTLREDALFTDGTPVLAEDVVYTYSTAKDSGSEIDLTMVKHITAVDEHTVEFKITRPYSPFIEKLAYLGIVPQHAHNENFKDQPIGSGPYEFIQWDKGQQVIVKANESYYGDIPKIKKLTIVFLETDTAFLAVKNGDVDVVQVNGSLASSVSTDLKVIDLPSIECYGISFPMIPNEGEVSANGATMGNDVTNKLAIRQAINTAIDRQQIVDKILYGYGTVSTTGLEKMPWLNEDTILAPSEYADIDKAKAILLADGWEDTDGDGIVEKDGLVAEFDLLYTDGLYRQEMALESANIAKLIGIKMNLRMVTWDTILPDIHKEAVLFGFGSGDPSELYNLYYGRNAGGVIPWDNAGLYNNESVNEIIDEALNAYDEEDAIPYWKALQAHTSAKGDAPYSWLVNVNHVYIAAKEFSFGTPVVQPHGGRIFDNVNQWSWE